MRQRVEGIQTRVTNLRLETDGVLGEVWPYHDQMDEAAAKFLTTTLTKCDAAIRDLFQKWLDRFAARQERNVTPQRKRLRGE